MRRQLLALSCLGSLAALSTPVAVAQASTATPAAECRVGAVKPYLDQKGMIRGTGIRSGCDDRALLRVRIKQAKRGPDRTLKSGSLRVTNGTITAGVRCTDVPRRYYVVAIDYRGHKQTSRAVTLSCESPATPTPTPTTSPSTSPTTPPPSSAPTTPPPSGGGIGTAIEEEVVKLTNAARAQQGCGALVHDAKLHAAADAHSADMSAKNYFSHTSADGRSFGQRLKDSGFAFTMAGENIAKGYTSAQAVVNGWLNSPGHRANIMNCKFTHIGVGHVAAGQYWTQDFARP